MELEAKSVTIMPGSSQNYESLAVCQRAVESHKKSCKADLVFLDNTSDNQAMRMEMQTFVEARGYEYEYLSDKFSWTKFCNYGSRKIEGSYDYVVHANADAVFFHGWLHYILELWNQHDNRKRFFSMHPYVYSPINRGVNFRHTTSIDHRIVPCDHPMMHVSVFREADEFMWDERFNLYEADCDVWMWLRLHGHTSGIAYSSRVDHVAGSLVSTLPRPKASSDYEGKSELFDKWKHVMHVSAT